MNTSDKNEFIFKLLCQIFHSKAPMLKDSEIVNLRKDVQYKQVIRAGLKSVASDLIGKGQVELKPELGTLTKLSYSLFKARVVRVELYSSSASLLERLLNSELGWPRTPSSIKEICEAERENYIWMRYAEAPVTALLMRGKTLLSDAAFRDVTKRHAIETNEDKNARLSALRNELDALLEKTLLSLRTRGIFDKIVDLRKERFYQDNEESLKQGFLRAEQMGNLGLPPPDGAAK